MKVWKCVYGFVFYRKEFVCMLVNSNYVDAPFSDSDRIYFNILKTNNQTLKTFSSTA